MRDWDALSMNSYLLTFSLLISEDFWLSLHFSSNCCIFSAFFGGYKNAAIAGRRDEKPEILTKVNKVLLHD